MGDFRFYLDGRTLTKSEEKIVNYIYQHLSIIPFLSIGKIAEELNISVATLSRFVRHMGYESLKDLKVAIMEHENVTTPAGKLQKTLSMADANTAVQLLKRQEACLAQTRENLSEPDVKKAVAAIRDAETVYFLGKGVSRGLVELFSFRLCRFQKRTVTLPPSGSELFERLVDVKQNDLVILFGFYKMPVEARVTLEQAREVGCKTLLFTDRLYSDEEQRGDINLYVYRGELREYHSMAAAVALIDTLVVLTARELEGEPVQSLSDLYQLKEKYADIIPR